MTGIRPSAPGRDPEAAGGQGPGQGLKKKAVLLAILTTVLWSGSYILNKEAFREGIGPLTLSGLRYLLASALLFLPGIGRGSAKSSLSPSGRSSCWGSWATRRRRACSISGSRT